MWSYTGEESASPPIPISTHHNEDEDQLTPEVRRVGKIETILDLPVDLVDKIFSYLSYEDLAKLRPVNTQFDELAKTKLNRGFEKLGQIIKNCKNEIRKELPKRDSERRMHPLTDVSDLYECLDCRYEVLELKYKPYIEHRIPKIRICFAPGKIIDEFQRLLNVLEQCRKGSGEFIGDHREFLQEASDLSIMAEEYFDDHIRPQLDEDAEKTSLDAYSFPKTKARAQRRATERKWLHKLDVKKKILSQLKFSWDHSPASHKTIKAMQDKIDEQQKRIDLQQAEINVLKKIDYSTMNFLYYALPNKFLDLEIRLECASVVEEHKQWLNRPSTSTSQDNKNVELSDSTSEESEDNSEKE